MTTDEDNFFLFFVLTAFLQSMNGLKLRGQVVAGNSRLGFSRCLLLDLSRGTESKRAEHFIKFLFGGKRPFEHRYANHTRRFSVFCRIAGTFHGSQ